MAQVKRKADDDDDDGNEEENKRPSKKQDRTEKFVAPKWFACGLNKATHYMDWQWYRTRPQELYARFYAHLGVKSHAVPPTWLFAPVIEPLIMQYWFDGQYRGLAAIIAEYAEFEFVGSACMLMCSDWTHADDMMFYGDWCRVPVSLDLKISDSSRLYKDAHRALRGVYGRKSCKECRNAQITFGIPYPTTSTVK